MVHAMKYNVLILFLMMGSSLSQAVELEATLNWAPLQRYGFVVNGLVSDKVVNVGSQVEQGDLLAQLDTQPFQLKINQFTASVNKYDPLVFDAKVELDHANELYERTVLSEVELQKIEGKYKTVIAQQKTEKAKLKLAQWELRRASLKSKDDAYVVSSDIFPGMIISEENKSAVYIEMASAEQASASAWLSNEHRLQLKSDSRLEVIIDDQTLSASVYSLTMLPSKDDKYQLIVVFNYNEMSEPGKKVKIRF